MRVVIDSNVLISGLLFGNSVPGKILSAWRQKAFILLTCEIQLQELRDVTRRPQIKSRLNSAVAGALINQLQANATWITHLPLVEKSLDPFDNFLLSMTEGGQADLLVSGDKRGVLELKTHHQCRIITVRQFAVLLNLA